MLMDYTGNKVVLYIKTELQRDKVSEQSKAFALLLPVRRYRLLEGIGIVDAKGGMHLFINCNLCFKTLQYS